jgi:hypothetical protein
MALLRMAVLPSHGGRSLGWHVLGEIRKDWLDILGHYCSARSATTRVHRTSTEPDQVGNNGGTTVKKAEPDEAVPMLFSQVRTRTGRKCSQLPKLGSSPFAPPTVGVRLCLPA